MLRLRSSLSTRTAPDPRATHAIPGRTLPRFEIEDAGNGGVVVHEVEEMTNPSVVDGAVRRTDDLPHAVVSVV